MWHHNSWQRWRMLQLPWMEIYCLKFVSLLVYRMTKIIWIFRPIYFGSWCFVCLLCIFVIILLLTGQHGCLISPFSLVIIRCEAEQLVDYLFSLCTAANKHLWYKQWWVMRSEWQPFLPQVLCITFNVKSELHLLAEKTIFITNGLTN